MKIVEYRYKILMTGSSTYPDKEYSLQDFIEEYSLWYTEDLYPCKIEILNREKHKIVYSQIFKDGDRAPSYIMNSLLEGVPEHKAIPKNTMTTFGDIIRFKDAQRAK